MNEARKVTEKSIILTQNPQRERVFSVKKI
jgi:hypothetical protein